jgi:hypothetical protein
MFVELVSSRDRVHWTREEGNRPPILGLGAAGTWDASIVMTARAPVVEGNTMKVWYGGFKNQHDTALKKQGSAIGLATLRKDGFVSLDAGATAGTILTRSLSGAAGPLRVNYQAISGSLKVEVLDQNGNVLPGYSEAECLPLTGDSVDQPVTWTTHAELPVGMDLLRLRFILQNGSVYSFMTGESASFPQAPAITRQPASRTNLVGTVATFTVQATGFPVPDFQWQKNEANLSDSAHYSGCNTPTLTITGTDGADAASYRCLATNISGSVTSSPATLTVEEPSCIEIANADFENGFRLAGGGYIANNWLEWEASPGATIGYEESAITHDGSRSQRIRVWGVTNSTAGGVYQRVPVTTGQPFTVSVWIYAADIGSACSVGVDPGGGTSANSGVTWSSTTTNAAWTQKTVTGTATSDFITVYFRVASSDGNKRNGYFDTAAPGLPAGLSLLAAQSNGNSLTLTWPACPSARLEQTDSLLPTTIWAPVTNQVSMIGDQKVVTLTPTAQSATGFLRLVRE